MSAPVLRPPRSPSGAAVPAARAPRCRGAVALVGRVGLVGVLAAAVGGAVWASASWSGTRHDPAATVMEIPALQVEPAPVVLGTVAQPSAATPPAAVPQTVVPQTPAASSAPTGPSVLARPLDTLRDWADRMAGRTGVPARALYAYGLADLAMRKIEPGCHLSWVTLAGIGRVESDHGRFGGAVLGPDGRESRPVIGVPLDGSGGSQAIGDTDRGALDGDPVLDHAVGPMQFIPSTWAHWRSDATGDHIADPENIDDAALSAARYLCADNRDLATGPGWSAAVLSYNNSVIYGQRVYGAAASYAKASGTA